MLIQKIIGDDNSKKCQTALNALWLFCLVVEAQLVSLPLASSKVTCEGILASLATAACLWA